METRNEPYSNRQLVTAHQRKPSSPTMTSKLFRAVPGLLSFALFSWGVAYGADATNTADARSLKSGKLMYVGTFTGTPANSKGIYAFWVHLPDRKPVVPLGVAAETPFPTFLALDAKRRLLFCANGIDTFQGKPSGAVSSFAIDATTGKLKFINQQPSMGTHPCHLALDKSGRNLIVANYNSGSVAVFPVGEDGHIGEATCVIQDTGHSVNPVRQAGPHAHCITFSPDERFVFVCDFGIDKVLSYKFDAEHGKLIPNDPPFVSIKPGSGPRHLTFRPDGQFAYLISELASTVTAFAYDAKAGTLNELQTVSCVPNTFTGANAAAEIAVDPAGKFLFASNRGDNSVAEFKIDPNNGTLTWIGSQSTLGKTPRFFGIARRGLGYVACNQESDTVVFFGLDASSGKLIPSETTVPVPAPACAVFFPR